MVPMHSLALAADKRLLSSCQGIVWAPVYEGFLPSLHSGFSERPHAGPKESMGPSRGWVWVWPSHGSNQVS